MKLLQKEEINDLLTVPIISRAYEEYKKEHTSRNIVDMYSMLSNTGMNPDYVYIKYLLNNKIYTFEYKEGLG